jgi:hypothetical protein
MLMISSLVCVSRLPVGSSASNKNRDQRTRDGDALLLTAGQLARQVVLAPVQTHLRQRGARPLVLIGERQVAVVERQLDVLQRRRARQQVEVLKDEAELAIAQRRARVGGEMRDVLAAEAIGARGRTIEAANDVHEGRLPEPDAPMMATNCPASMSSETPRSASTSTSPSS